MPLPWLVVYFFLIIMYFFVFIFINYLGSLESPKFSVLSKNLSLGLTNMSW